MRYVHTIPDIVVHEEDEEKEEEDGEEGNVTDTSEE